MIVNPDETLIISSLGWVDKANLWLLDTRSDDIKKLELSDANYISLHHEVGNFFSIVHHYDGKKVVISSHSFEKPDVVMSKIHLEDGVARFEGDNEIWKKLPKSYPEYIRLPVKSDFYLLLIDPIRPELKIIDLEWYDDSYDKGYQGVIGAIEVPKSPLVIISVQRNSNPILYNVEESKVVKECI
jgi:hypothetical protein